MVDEKEIKESMKNNKEIREQEGKNLSELLRNSTEDKDMRRAGDLQTNLITRTTNDDNRDKRRKIIAITSFVILALALIGACVYYFFIR